MSHENHPYWPALYLSCIQGSVYSWEPHIFDKRSEYDCKTLQQIFSLSEVYEQVATSSIIYGVFRNNQVIIGDRVNTVFARQDLRKFLALPPANPETITIAKRILAVLNKFIDGS